MSTATPPPGGGAPLPPADHAPPRGWTDVRFRAWNLLLLVPLISIVPPLFNMAEPRLGGLPFFYWFQIAIVPVGILCTVAVHRMTRGVDDEASAAGAVAGRDLDADADTDTRGGRS
jgi:hypothetical protein